jgi:hypothetical protein
MDGHEQAGARQFAVQLAVGIVHGHLAVLDVEHEQGHRGFGQLYRLHGAFLLTGFYCGWELDGIQIGRATCDDAAILDHVRKSVVASSIRAEYCVVKTRRFAAAVPAGKIPFCRSVTGRMKVVFGRLSWKTFWRGR